MLEDLNEIQKFAEKYATGDYICVVDNRFGGKDISLKKMTSLKRTGIIS